MAQIKKGIRSKLVDTNRDGRVTKEEIDRAEALLELENKDQKEDQLRKLAWIAMISMITMTVWLFTPFVSAEKITALDNIIGMFYIAQAGVVASFFGSSAYMSRTV